MSGRGIDFLENWIQQNVTEADKGGDAIGVVLADKCREDAAAQGITVDDMEPEFGTVKKIIYETMHNDMDAELEFWKAWAAMRDKPERLH
jgi:hypothetical protein